MADKKLLVNVLANTTSFTKGMNNAKKSNQSFTQTVKRNSKAIGASFIAMGAAIAAVGIMSIKTYAQMGDQVQKMAQRTGFATEALSELRHAAELSGTTLDAMVPAIRRFQRIIAMGDLATNTWKNSLAELGLTYKDLERLSPEDQFVTILEALADVETAAKRTDIAYNVLGDSGTALLPMLENGAEGLKAMREEAHELGIVFDQEAANKAAKMNDALEKLEQSINGVKIMLADSLLPTVISVVESITGAVKSFRSWADENPALSKALIAVTFVLGGVLTVVGAIILLGPGLVAMLATAGISFATFAATVGAATLAITGVTLAILAVTGAFDDFNDVTPAVGLSLKGLEFKADGLRKKLAGLTTGSNDYVAAAKELKTVTNEITQAQADMAFAQEEVERSLNDGTTAAERNADALAKAKDNLKETTEEFNAAKAVIAEFERNIADVNRELQELTAPRLTGMQAFEDQIFAIGQQIKQLNLAESVAPEGMKERLREQIALLEKQRQQLELTRDITFDPIMRRIREASEEALGLNKEITERFALSSIEERALRIGPEGDLTRGLLGAEMVAAGVQQQVEMQTNITIHIENLVASTEEGGREAATGLADQIEREGRLQGINTNLGI